MFNFLFVIFWTIAGIITVEIWDEYYFEVSERGAWVMCFTWPMWMGIAVIHELQKFSQE